MTDESDEKVRQAAATFLRAIPHAVELGLMVEGAGPGWAAFAMPWNPQLVGDPASGVVHGGAVSTLLDTVSGASVLSHPQAGGPTATMDLRIDYMRPATPGQTIRARAECHHVTRTVAFIRAVATDDDASRPVATAVGTFALERRTP